jgi:hypothetical protein
MAVGGTVGGIVGGLLGQVLAPLPGVGAFAGSAIGSGLVSNIFGGIARLFENTVSKTLSNFKMSVMTAFNVFNSIMTLSMINFKEWTLENIIALAFAFLNLAFFFRDMEENAAANTDTAADSNSSAIYYQIGSYDMYTASSEPVVVSSGVLGQEYYIFDDSRVKSANIVSRKALSYAQNLTMGKFGLFNSYNNEFYSEADLILDTYSDLGLHLKEEVYSSSYDLQEAFRGQGTYYDLDDNFYINLVKPGYIVFFRAKESTSDSATHVGIVYEITKDYVKTIEANSYSIENYYLFNFDSSKIFASNGALDIIGFAYADNFETVVNGQAK